MNLHIHFILVNSEFSQGYADDVHNGQETEDNIKYLSEDELKVSEPVKDFKIKNNTIYTLAGYMPDDKPFSFEIWDVTILDCTTEDGNKMQFAVSKKLIKKTDLVKDEKNKETHLYFYLKDAIEYVNPMDGVYILKSDFPKELNKKKADE